MKQIGLITFHRTTNFGSLLQTYALYKKIIDLGFHAEIIDYRCKYLEEKEGVINKKPQSLKKRIAHLIFGPKNKKKKLKIELFIKDNMNISKSFTKDDIEEIKDHYYKYFVGSDIVWGRDITNHDYTYFLDFVSDDKKKYAFSSSVGYYDKYYDDAIVSDLLKGFNKIAVREDSAVEWVSNLSGKSASLVCDPTMLLSADEWISLIPPEKFKKGYVLVYFNSDNNKCLNDAIEYAKHNNLKVLYICNGFPKSNFKRVWPTDLSEYLGLIYNADAIFTASYHGMLFSLYFNKRFYFYTRAHSSRMLSLAKKIGIEKQCADIEINTDEIDYELINKNVSRFRENSINILKEMLNE